VQAYVDGESELIVVQPTHIFSPAFEDGMMFQWPGNVTATDLVDVPGGVSDVKCLKVSFLMMVLLIAAVGSHWPHSMLDAQSFVASYHAAKQGGEVCIQAVVQGSR
jgi:hypothetical protein